MRRETYKIQKKASAVLLSVTLAMSMSLTALAEDPTILPDNPEGETVEVISVGEYMAKNEGTINSVEGELEENWGVVENVAPRDGEDYDSPIGKISANFETGYVNKLDGEILVNAGHINELNGYAEYNLGYIKSKSDKSEGLWENYGIIESDDGNNPYCSYGGPTHMNAGVILKEKNVVCANYGVLNMNGGYGISYNGICHDEALSEYALPAELEDSRGIVISNTDHFIIQNGSDSGIFIFREGT